MLLSPGSTTSNLKTNSGIWSKIKKKASEWDGTTTPQPSQHQQLPQQQQPPPTNMMSHFGGMGGMGGMGGGAVMRQRFLTLVHGDMETIKLMPNSYAEAEAMAREWVRPPPEASFHLRVPVEYASLQASRLIHGPWLWISSEETYQIASQGVHGLRIEIVTDAPPPPEEPPAPPPPPVLDMPATFNLELSPGNIIGLETLCTSDDCDMSRTDDGTLVAGMFWGKLEIIHDGDTHTMEFTGTKKDEALPNEFFFDQKVMTKLAVAAKPTTARCHIYMASPEVQYADIVLSLHSLWKFGQTWPFAEPMGDHKVKFFVRVHPGGALEDITNQAVVSSLYYETMPDTSAFDPSSYISPYNGFAMPVTDFIPHISRVLDSLGLSLQTRTHFVSNNIAAFMAHRNIAYRFMSPSRLTAAIDISVSMESCAFNRLFLLFKGVSDEEMAEFAGSGEKEANSFDWRDTVGFNEAIRDPNINRVIETSIMDCTA